MTLPPLSEIRAACAAATPGPWVAEDDPVCHPQARIVRREGSFDWIGAFHLQTSNCPNWKNDQNFITSARTWVPALLERVERLGGALGEIRNLSALHSSDYAREINEAAVRALEVPSGS